MTLPSLATEERLLREARERKMEAFERDCMSAAEQDQLIRMEAARQQAMREAEEARIEAERLAKEKQRKWEQEEGARKAAKKAREEACEVEITVPIHHVFAPGEIVAEVAISHGSTVSDLAGATYNLARLPFYPRLLRGDGEALQPSWQLIDCGVKDQEPLLAELSVVLTASK